MEDQLIKAELGLDKKEKKGKKKKGLRGEIIAVDYANVLLAGIAFKFGMRIDMIYMITKMQYYDYLTNFGTSV